MRETGNGSSWLAERLGIGETAEGKKMDDGHGAPKKVFREGVPGNREASSFLQIP